MHLSALLPLATAALAVPSKRDAQWGAWPHGGGEPPHGSWPPQGWGSQASSSAVAYFLDNNPSGSSLVSLHIAENGSLSEPLRTSTGGKGATEVDSTGSPVAVDGLGSQGAVTISGNLIFTVNAGSNTVSLFTIDHSNPYSPRLVGTPVSSQGEFPISVTYSQQIGKACVLNGGSVAGVSCYHVNPSSGLTIDGPLRRLNSTIINESTPPSAPPGSAAQVLFNPDSSAVFATVKANSTTVEGSLLAWPVANGEVSTAEPVVTHINGIVFDFGFQFLSQDTIFLTDPSFGASLLHVASDLTATETAHTVLPGEGAVCWTESEPSLNTIYAIDSDTNFIYKLNLQTGAYTGTIEVQLDGKNSSVGLYDSSIRNGLLYSLAGSNGIVIVDLAEEKQVAYFDLSTFGDRQGYMGFAIWP